MIKIVNSSVGCHSAFYWFLMEKGNNSVLLKHFFLFFKRPMDSELEQKHILKHYVVKHSNARRRDCFVFLCNNILQALQSKSIDISLTQHLF